MEPPAKATMDLSDALWELDLQLTYVRETLGPRNMVAAAEDALEGELAKKIALVRECAEALRAAARAVPPGLPSLEEPPPGDSCPHCGEPRRIVGFCATCEERSSR